MKLIFFLNLILLEINLFNLAPILEEKKDDSDYNKDVEELTYKKYLKEVINLLTIDPEFKKQLLADGNNITENPESISSNLAYLSHGIRSQLDELKRKELDRLRSLLKIKDHMKKSKITFDLPDFKAERILAHMDYVNPNSFEAKDFDKLINKATLDLKEIDKRRQAEFKRYEMMKELEKRERFQKMSEEEKAMAIKKLDEMQKKHDDHPKLHHPGNEEQLKEVWEDDGMDREDFDPRTFFFLHDTNSDGIWDDNEIEALFQKELDKAYNPEAAEDDMMQRYEEMYRMREHVINEVDINKDRVVSLKEFLHYASQKEFKNDKEWETIDSKKVYTEEELKAFEEEKNRMINLAKNKVRINVDPNVVRMQQDSAHQNIPQQHDNAPHQNIPLQQHIPQQEQLIPQQPEYNQQQQNVPQHHQQVEHNNIPQQADNAPHDNIPLQQHIPQQENIPQHQNAQPLVNNLQHDVPQQHDLPQQHDNVPQQQHIPEDSENQQHYILEQKDNNFEQQNLQQYDVPKPLDDLPQQQHFQQELNKPSENEHFKLNDVSQQQVLQQQDQQNN